MNYVPHLLVRLRRRALQVYDLLLYLMLLALAAAAFLPSGGQETLEPADQCGNIQSSAVVIIR